MRSKPTQTRRAGIFAALATAALAAGLPSLPPTQAQAQAAPASQPYTWRNVEINGGGGFITGIVFHPKQPGLMYCRTDIGGVYRWGPRDGRWVALTDWVGQDNGNLRGGESLAVDPTDPNRVYVAAGTYLQPQQKTAILRSSDQGRTWKQAPLPVEMGGNEDGRSIGERLVVDPHDPRILLFGSRRDGLWRSQDYGATWSRVASFPDVPNDPPRAPGAPWQGRRTAGVGWTLFDPNRGVKGRPSPILYAGVAAPGVPTLLRSTDAGQSWQPVPGAPALIPHHAAIGADGILYLTYGDSLGPNGIGNGAVWKMDTRTGTWTDITPAKPEHGGGYAGLALDPRHPGTLVVSTLDRWNPGDDIYRTRDGGAHWAGVAAQAVLDPAGAPWLNWGNPKPRFGWWIGALALDPFRPGRVLYGTGATIWGTDDVTAADRGLPTHWRMYAPGLEETAVTALVSPPAGPPLVSGLGDIGGFTHDNLNVSPPGGMPLPVFTTTSGLDVAWQRPAVMVRVGSASPENHGGALSTDGGVTWTAFAGTPTGSRGGGSAVLTADGATIVWAAQRAPVSFSRDGGKTWAASTGLPQPDPTAQNSYFGQVRLMLAADRAEARRVYALDGDGGRLYISNDGGASFTQSAATGLPTGANSLVVMPGRAGDLWATAGGHGLFHSTDAGATFVAVPTVGAADGVGFGKAAPGASIAAIYLVGSPTGGAHGVWRSDDGGQAWVRINDDAHQYGWIGQPVTGDPRVYGRVYLGTNGRGIIYGEPSGAARTAHR